MSQIIVVDDDCQLRATLTRTLEDAGYQVLGAADAKAGLALCREHHPDLVIADILMPDKDGIETIMELRRDLPEVKIIAISGGGLAGPESYLELARHLGARRVFAKPVSSTDLLSAVRELLADGT